MLRFPTHEAKTEGPVEILIGSRQLQEVMERSTVDLDRSCTTIEGGGLKEDDLVEGVGRHVNLMKTHRRTKTPFYTAQDKGTTLKRKITTTLLKFTSRRHSPTTCHNMNKHPLNHSLFGDGTLSNDPKNRDNTALVVPDCA